MCIANKQLSLHFLLALGNLRRIKRRRRDIHRPGRRPRFTCTIVKEFYPQSSKQLTPTNPAKRLPPHGKMVVSSQVQARPTGPHHLRGMFQG
jgi:hypothetical protein